MKSKKERRSSRKKADIKNRRKNRNRQKLYLKLKDKERKLKMMTQLSKAFKESADGGEMSEESLTQMMEMFTKLMGDGDLLKGLLGGEGEMPDFSELLGGEGDFSELLGGEGEMPDFSEFLEEDGEIGHPTGESD